MESWMGAVFIPLVVAGIGWVAVEFTGGVEGRQQRKILGYLQIARELGDTPEGRGVHRVATAETGRLLEERGTKAQLAGAVAGLAFCVVVIAVCLLVAIVVALTEEAAEAWAGGFAGTGLAALYAYGGYQFWRQVKRVSARRREQRPTSLLIAVALPEVPRG